MEELKEQIKDYERKNNEYKQKISDIFELKDKNGMEKTNFGNEKDNPFEIKFENLSQSSSIDENEKEENNSIFELNDYLMIGPKKIE